MLINLPSLNMETHLLVLVILLVMIQLSVGDLEVMVIQQLFARIVLKTGEIQEILSFLTLSVGVIPKFCNW